MLLIRTDHAHDAAAANDLAFVANPLDRCSYFHSFSTIRPRVTSRELNSNLTRSPTSTRMKFFPGPLGACAVICLGPSISTRYCAYGSVSRTMPSAEIKFTTSPTREFTNYPGVATGRAVSTRGPSLVTATG